VLFHLSQVWFFQSPLAVLTQPFIGNMLEDHSTASPNRLSIHIYGDATAEQRRTSASRTDWQIIKDFFGRYPDRFQASFNVPRTNPTVKDRINLMNARLRNHAGQHRLIVHRDCHHLIRDFEEVQWKSDRYGNTLADLNKSNPARTHVSDALGYFIAREFSMRPEMGERSGPPLL